MNLRSHRILVIDDDPEIFGVVRAALRDEDLEIDTAPDGSTALQLASKERYDLILLDLGLPEVDGFTVLSRLKEREKDGAAGVPVTVLTAWNTLADKIRGFEAGAVDYITKPFEVGELRARVRSTLRTKRLQDQLTSANAQLEKARLAAEANTRSKSEFLANMSHEIRTPMNGVIAMTSLLRGSDLSAEQRGWVETIRTSGEALLTIINEILDLSKIESARMELETQPFSLRECVEEALDLLAPKAWEKKLDLSYQLSQQLPATVTGDAMRLRQILVNLIGNAIKFTEKGEVALEIKGQPATSARAAAPSAGQPLEISAWELFFTIRDTGIGIPPDRLDRLFKSFSQVDASTSRKYGGTGLGLAISKSLVELMGGRMWAESGFSQGSSFHFTVPLPGTLATVQPCPVSRLSGLRVLVVDDNPTYQELLASQLRHWGVRPQTTASAADALALLRNGPRFDAAVVDFHLPDLTGLDLTAAARMIPQNHALPFLFLTSGLTSEETTSIGRAETITKPIKPALVFEALTRIIYGEQRVPRKMVAPPALDAALADRFPMRILLVDDNFINQRVAVQLLQQMGYRSEIANNGREAIAALQRQTYDLVFMDVQMPEMDGLETTRRIRELERNEAREASRSHTLIVAMTANAMQGDKEECLASGMDDYLPKPVRPEALRAALERWGSVLTTRRQANGSKTELSATNGKVSVSLDSKPAPSTSEAPPVDMDRFRELAGGDDAGVRELMTLYLRQTEDQLQQLGVALAAQAPSEIRKLAHSCAGASATCGFEGIVSPLRALERMGHAGDLAEAGPELESASREFSRIRKYFASIVTN